MMARTEKVSILIVEDEQIVARDLQGVLQELGYDAFAVVASSDDALRVAATRRPDIALMDIRIRGQWDGIVAARQLRERYGVPVVFLTAHADEATVARAKQSEPYGYLVKPVNPSEIRSVLEIALHRHALETKARERERWFSTILHAIADVVVTVDLAGIITFVNPAAEKLLGVSAEEAIGRPVAELLDSKGLAVPPIKDVVRHREPILGREVHMVGKEGGESRILVQDAAPVVDGREVLGGIVMLRDVTEERKLRKQLEVSDRLASLGTMAAGVAHEVNNPLSVVRANAEDLSDAVAIARRTCASTTNGIWGRVEEDLTDLMEATSRIARIVSDLRVFARPSESEAAVVDLPLCVDWAIRTTASEFRHRAPIIVRLDGHAKVRAEKTRLEQVLVNLLVNAAHAIPPGAFDRNRVEVRSFPLDEKYISIRISDTGVGIPEEDLGRVFEPFFTTKALGEGTGLGLSICKGIVRSFGGELSVESRLHEGTTVSVVLPRAGELSEAPPASRHEEQVPRLNVLLVDDDELVIRAVRRVLTNHELTIAQGAREALEIIEAGASFDAIISDLMMPGMTGKAFYEVLGARHPSLLSRVVFLTGGATSVEFDEFLRGVPNACVEKPFEGAVLRQAVANLFNRRLGGAKKRRVSQPS